VCATDEKGRGATISTTQPIVKYHPQVSLCRCRAMVAAALLVGAAGCARLDAPPRDIKGGDGGLRLSLPGEPRSLNPNLFPFDEYTLLVTQNIFSRLVTRASDGTVLPELAERWTESADGRTYTFYLRKDVRFHDGAPLTSEDVRSTFARIGESSNTEVALRIAGVDAPDATMVNVHLKAPWAAFIPSIAWYGASILPAHVYGSAAWNNNPANRRPIGSGPFKFKVWEPGRRIVLEKNTAFFGQGPYVDELEYVITPTAAEGAQLLVSGRVDFMVGRPPGAMIRQLAHTPGLHVSMAPSDGRTYLAFNVRRAAFSDLRMRRAANLAIDRQALIVDTMGGLGMPAFGFYTPAVAWAYNGAARVPAYDPVAAIHLVRAAHPPPVTLAFVGSPGAAPTPVSADVARQLTAVGMRVTAVPVPAQQFVDYLRAGEGFDLVVLSGFHGPDPDTMTARFGSAGSMQMMGYSNPELDRVLARGGAVADPVARARAYYRAQEILAEDLPIAPLFETLRIAVYRDGLRGLPDDDARGLVPDNTFNLVRIPAPSAARRTEK
jgi:peptide/nickel transport system substrate-binding protein